MVGNYSGYLMMLLFALIFIGIASLVSKRFKSTGVDDFIVAGRSIPYSFIAASVMISWIWTMTIMGAAEAGVWFGVSGGFNYAWGAAVPFFVFIPLVVRIRKTMPRTTAFTEFVEQRYGHKVSRLFFVFGVGVITYVFVVQGVGIGIAFNSVFNVPYAVGAFVPVAIVTIYVARAGLRGSLINDIVQFVLVSSVFIITIPMIISSIGTGNIYDGLMDVVTNVENINHNPEALSLGSTAGLRYGLTAVVVAMGQVLFDQGYYSKALSTVSSKAMLRAYLIGTVLAWMPVPIISGNVFGCSVIALGIGDGMGIDITSEAAPYMLELVFGTGIGAGVFIMMIFMCGMTTGGNCLVGAQALFTVDFYKKYVNKTATEAQQTLFARKITLVIGAVVGIIAILLQGISMLKIDIFSGILFAAPTSAFVAGLIWKRTPPSVAVASIFIGLGAGIAAWLLIADQDLNWFIGNMLALFLPAVVVIIGSLFTKYEFDFSILKDYEPDHKVELIKE